MAENAVGACLAAYRSRMAGYSTARQLDIWYYKVTVDDLIGVFTSKDQKRASTLIAKSTAKKTSAGAAKQLTERVDGGWRITEQPPNRTHLLATPAATVYTAYRDSLDEDRRHLLDRFTPVDAVQQVVGVRSVGMRVYLVLLNGRHDNDPLFMQIKQAGPSVYGPFCGAGVHTNRGQRVAAGQWLILAPRLVEFASACGGVRARAHARSGDPIAINAYIGKGRKFDPALGQFAVACADQTATDHQQLLAAVNSGAIPSAPGW